MSDQSFIRVKLLTKEKVNDISEQWLSHLPERNAILRKCRFIFDRNEKEYDWLVVYDDMPSVQGERFTLWKEALSCPREQTILVTNEPPTVKAYGKKFMRQFGHVVSSQEPVYVKHPNQIYQQCGMIWFYQGNYSDMLENPPNQKTNIISTVCSSKQQKHTLHNRRYQFTQEVKKALPELDVFGRGVRQIEKKNEALDTYRYHIAIENHYAPHHWTEKLADSFLGLTLPFYYGCPNAEEYFPEESFIRIDLQDVERSLAIIKQAIQNNEYEKRLPAILEARRLTIEKYSFFENIERIISKLHASNPIADKVDNSYILSRHRHRSEYPISSLSLLYEKFKARYLL